MLLHESLDALESFYILKFNTTDKRFGYNKTEGGATGIRSNETKELIRKKALERVNKEGFISPNKGRKASEETRKRISESKKGNIPYNKGLKMKEELIRRGWFHTQEAKNQISLKNKGKTPNKGKKLSEATKLKISIANRNGKRSRPVINLNTKEIYVSLSEAYRVTGIELRKISRVCDRKQNFAGGFVWSWYDENVIYTEDYIENQIREIKRITEKPSQKISVINLSTGEIYTSMTEASKLLNISSAEISRCCKRGGIKGGGYYWEINDTNIEYTKEVCLLKIKEIETLHKKTTSVLDIDNNIIYDDGLSASRETNIPSASIYKCCSGVTKTAGGIHWKYLENDKKQIKRNKKTKHKNSKSVINLDTKEIYPSVAEAGELNKIGSSDLAKACRNKKAMPKGYHWAYYYEGLEKDDIKILELIQEIENNRNRKKVTPS